MDQSQLQRSLAQAKAAQRGGRLDEAARIYRSVLATAGEHPLALNALGIMALRSGDAGGAAPLFRRAIAADPNSAELWINLATACRTNSDEAGEKQALDGALSIDRRHFMALVRTAEWHERRGEAAQAAERWSGVLAMAPLLEQRTPALEEMLRHAQAYVVRRQEDFAALVERGLADARSELAHREKRRFDACVDHMLGRRNIYANDPAGLHFPFLPAEEFFDRIHFPWLEQIEAQTDAIRTELQALLASPEPGLSPYVAMEPGTPANKWSALDNKPDWSALHLWKNGVRDDAACARCPVTTAAVEALPLTDIPGRTPTVFFSVLRPGAHLPAHTGVTNIRTIIHLPLIVPEDCTFRVGGETRTWREGEAWAFDDTIEHEAWNRSEHARAILIFETWNPYLSEAERGLLRQFYPLADEHYAGQPVKAD